MNSIQDLLFKIIKSAIDGTAISESILLSEDEEKRIYALSKAHDMAHLVSYALDKNNIRITNEQVSKNFKKQQMLAVLRYERQNYDFQQLCALFNALEIRFIPLKGAVIRSMYPAPWMRTSCDIDILIDKSDISKARGALQEKLGYSFGAAGDHDLSFITPSEVHFELHFSLLNYKNEDKCLQNVWKYAHPKKPDTFEYVLEDEVLYYYHIYHMAKHFINGGCGVKPFLDLWMFKKNGLSVKKTGSDFLKNSNLYCFSKKSEQLSGIWFEEDTHTELSRKMEEYVLSGGVYGNALNKKSVGNKKLNLRYKVSRIWLPTWVMKIRYSNLQKHIWLLPFYQVKRWFGILSRAIRNKPWAEDIDSNSEAESLASYLKKSLEL